MKTTIDMNQLEGMGHLTCYEMIDYLVENEHFDRDYPIEIRVNGNVWVFEQVDLPNERTPGDIEFDLMMKNCGENMGDECLCCGKEK